MATSHSTTVARLAKLLLFAVCLAPLALLVARGAQGTLGANPVETLIHATGEWTLRLLLATLAITPLRRLTGQDWLARLRRPLGLFTFFYGSLHLAGYLWLDRSFDWGSIGEDILKRPYITAGFAAFALMVPLALTSTRTWVRRLGARWTLLHRAAYLAAALAVVHFLWLVKADLFEPLIYGAILVLLLALRVSWRRTRVHADARLGPLSERR